ncbi:MAG: mechanosensitive ion channel [Alphaproteobacteria bacterium]
MYRYLVLIAICLNLSFTGLSLRPLWAQTEPAPAHSQPQLDRPLSNQPQTDKSPSPSSDSFAARIADWTRGMNAADQYVNGKQQASDRTEKFKSNLLRIRGEAIEARDQAQVAATAVERLLRALGPTTSGESAAPEAPAVTSSRKTYQDQITTLRGEAAQAALAIARADSLLMALDVLDQRKFIARLLRQYPPPLAAIVVEQTVRDSLMLIGKLIDAPFDWLANLDLDGAPLRDFLLYKIGILLLPVIIIGAVTRRWIVRRFGRDPHIKHPHFVRALFAALAEAIGRGLIPGLLLSVFLFRAWSDNAVGSGLFQEVIKFLCLSAILFVVGVALSGAVLSPRAPEWRVLPVTGSAATHLNRWIRLLLVVFAFDYFIVNLTNIIGTSSAFDSFFRLTMSGVEGGLVIMLAQPSLWRRRITQAQGEGYAAVLGNSSDGLWRSLRIAAIIIAAAGILSALVGYSILSRYLIHNLVITAGTIAALMLMRGLIREIFIALFHWRAFRRSLRFRREVRRTVFFWIWLALDIALAVATLFLVAPIWDVPSETLTRNLMSFFDRIAIGGAVISLKDIALAIIVFFAIIVLTRLFQRTVVERVLRQTRLDRGIQNSLTSGLGYLGVVLAGLFAITVMGLDLSSLAIVAGALSVGIGFGLQNIVNNFVSGLILLFERPVKVGDWVVVGDNQGYIRKIKVRSTEIETFQSATVIIPNAEFLSTAVLNWTHGNSRGRVDITISMHLRTDIKKAEDILLRCAKMHRKVLRRPEPVVFLQNITFIAIDLELRCYTDDISSSGSIASDIRKAAFTAFVEEEIFLSPIPAPALPPPSPAPTNKS